MFGDCCVNICQKNEEGDTIDAGGISTDSDEDSAKTGVNQFSIRKSFVNKLIDVALLMANVSQLNTLLDAGPTQKRYYALLTLIITSIALQVIFAIIELILVKLKNCDICNKDNATSKQIKEIQNSSNHDDESESTEKTGLNDGRSSPENKKGQTQSYCSCSKTEANLEMMSIVLVLFIIISNVFITGFGLSSTSA